LASASPEQIRDVLAKDPGLMVELKRLRAKQAIDKGQIVGEQDLADTTIVRADREVISCDQGGWWSGSVLSTAAHPGDTIVVPERPAMGDTRWRNFIALAQIAEAGVITAAIIPSVSMGLRPTQGDENRRCCHSPRKRGSTSVHIEVDSRFRGNDRHGAIFERAENNGSSAWRKMSAISGRVRLESDRTSWISGLRLYIRTRRLAEALVYNISITMIFITTCIRMFSTINGWRPCLLRAPRTT
jgi:hypothetical protein